MRVLLRIEAAANDPPRTFHRLKGIDDSKLRVGDWHVIVVLSHQSKTVLVQRIGHRSTVYQ